MFHSAGVSAPIVTFTLKSHPGAMMHGLIFLMPWQEKQKLARVK